MTEPAVPEAARAAIHAALLAAVRARVGGPFRCGEDRLEIAALAGRPEGVFDVELTHFQDPDLFSQYDTSTTWRGRATLSLRGDAAEVLSGELVVVEGEYYHRVGERVDLGPGAAG